eukprot:TRINITY_DN41402_c0_g1_i1.p1 TRINITY_DN41402_c0_g1~~TRINITY_DN41402_c0_g1_i1.p1  ORF type:complete len:517 (+),score=98.37 TRINITY_DN41402_c0_g1_i1:160-1710(+)
MPSLEVSTPPRRSLKRSGSAAVKLAPPSKGGGIAGHVTETVFAAEWCKQHADQLGKADELIGMKLNDARDRGTCIRLDLVDELFSNIILSNLQGSAPGQNQAGDTEDCNGSVLLLGESGSGKSHAIEACIKNLKGGMQEVVILRAYGGSYATDVECIRHLASQVAQGGKSQQDLPSRSASFEQGMNWLRGVLREGLRDAKAVVIILEKFEHFCSKARQTLLYNLFDIAQEAGVRLCIIGTSDKMDVMDRLEKRIKSRFSMRHLHLFRPTEMSTLLEILTEKLCLPSKCGLNPAFVKEYPKYLEAALKAKAGEWEPHIQVGRPPLWFLWKCLPVARFIRESGVSMSPGGECLPPPAALAPAPCAKRQRLVSSCTRREAQQILLDDLSEDEHVVALALLRLRERRCHATLSLVLHEIKVLHECGHFLLGFSLDRYTDAFDRLLQSNLVEVSTPASGDPARRYIPCFSRVDWFYELCIAELAGEPNPGVKRSENPLRGLPEAVQQWAVSQRGLSSSTAG